MIQNLYEKFPVMGGFGGIRMFPSLAERIECIYGCIPWEMDTDDCIEGHRQSWNNMGRPRIGITQAGAEFFNIPHSNSLNAKSPIITVLCSRIIYCVAYGEWPGDLYVCHTCDNGACGNPNHMFLGTAKENTGDMLDKGRHWVVKGSSHFRSVLNEDDINPIRHNYRRGCTVKSIADYYSVSEGAINSIVRGNSWKHVPHTRNPHLGNFRKFVN